MIVMLTTHWDHYHTRACWVGGGDAFWVRGFVFLFVGECSFGKVSGSFYLLLFLLMTTILVLVRLSSDYSWLRFHLSFLNVQ